MLVNNIEEAINKINSLNVDDEDAEVEVFSIIFELLKLTPQDMAEKMLRTWVNAWRVTLTYLSYQMRPVGNVSWSGKWLAIRPPNACLLLCRGWRRSRSTLRTAGSTTTLG